MLKRYIFVSALLTCSATVFAGSPVDSVGVENNNGKKLIIHKVDARESYYSISRRYNVNVKDLQAFNNNLNLQIGSIVKVPTDIPFISVKQVVSPKITSNGFFEYTVLAKDNLNLIAERFATTAAEIKRINDLSGNNLQIGQTLKVPFVKNSGGANDQNRTHQSSTVSSIATPVSLQNFTEHIVKPKEYLGVIAKQYGITVDELKAANDLSSINLYIGQVLKIPTKQQINENSQLAQTAPQVQPIKPAVEQKPEPKPEKKVEKPKPEVIEKADHSFTHTVAAGETIYAIAQKYKLTTYQLKNFNNLTTNDVAVGQKLIIKGEKPNIVEERDSAPTNSIDSTSLKNPSLRRPAAVYGLNRVEEKGTGVWISDADLDPNKMLILHRTAPVGTIIQISNPMTNRSTFAKVVGKFTENETTKDVIIVMTKAVADAVGALDKRFFCNLSYGPKENEK